MTRVPGLTPWRRPAPVDPATSADQHEEDVQVRRGLEQLQRAGRHAGDQQRLVGRMDVVQALPSGPRLGGPPRLVEVAAD